MGGDNKDKHVPSDSEPLENGSNLTRNNSKEDLSVETAPSSKESEPSNQDGSPPNEEAEPRQPEEIENLAMRTRSAGARLQESLAIQRLRSEVQEARSDRSARDLDYQHLSSAHARLANESANIISTLRERISQLEDIVQRQREEIRSYCHSAGERQITDADLRASSVFARYKEANIRALEALKERTTKQLARANDSVREAKRETREVARELNKELATSKKELNAQKKLFRTFENQSHKVRDMLSRTRVDLTECIKSKKNLQDDLKALTKTLASTEKERALTKRDLEKALKNVEVKKAEAAASSLKKEQVILEREKLRCENRLQSKVVEIELDRQKKESLLVTQANLKQDMEASKDDRAQGKRNRRVATAEDRILSSIRAVERVNRNQNGGQFPPLNSPEAMPFGQQYQTPPPPQYQTSLPHQATPTQDISSIVATVMTTMAGRGTNYHDDPLPEGVRLVRDPQTGRVFYNVGGHNYENRDDLFRKPSAGEPEPDPRRAFGTEIANLFPEERRVCPRVSPPALPAPPAPAPTVAPALPTVSVLAYAARPSEAASVDGDTPSVGTQPQNDASATPTDRDGLDDQHEQ